MSAAASANVAGEQLRRVVPAASRRWRWGVGVAIFFTGNLTGWATDGNPVGTAVALSCMLVLSWGVPVWIARRARPEKPAAPWADERVWWKDGAWRTRGRGYYWGFEPGGRKWHRGDKVPLIGDTREATRALRRDELLREQNRLIEEQNRLLAGLRPLSRDEVPHIVPEAAPSRASCG